MRGLEDEGEEDRGGGLRPARCRETAALAAAFLASSLPMRVSSSTSVSVSNPEGWALAAGAADDAVGSSPAEPATEGSEVSCASEPWPPEPSRGESGEESSSGRPADSPPSSPSPSELSRGGVAVLAGASKGLGPKFEAGVEPRAWERAGRRAGMTQP
eukprot:scaffold271763_cov26-Tisochrysis_lutea.AAC.1